MATATVTEFVTRTINATAATSSAANRATPQGGVFEHVDPSRFDPKNPIILFIIQAGIVIILTRIIHWPLALLRQPRVIAEVITGILLGPSVMGRIPGFTDHIFPTASMPGFTLAANIGLVLFLFLVGLEVDLRFLASNWRIALSVGALGMAVPFGLGSAIAWGLYRDFRNDEGLAHISFGIYMLFIGVAMAITAFPVLCRILTSLKLLGTPVGVIVLSAGVGNDVVGWILLALCVALVNSGAGLTALWILLVAIGYILFLVFLLRPVMMWFLRRTGSLANGPTQTVVALIILLVLASAFFTGIIGIHPIFGAFVIGLLLPHEGGFAIKLTEKIEDLVSVLFLPLYFALSGLSTNLGLLNSGLTWGYVVGVCAIAFVGKIAGGTLAARLNGLVWRESFTIGALMSCKGLVELIVLNIGLQAKILSKRTFTIFVVMALVTTFATTPLTVWLYPPWYQRKLELWKQGKIDWDGNPIIHEDDTESTEAETLRKSHVTKRILVYLRLDGLPSLFTMISLLAEAPEKAAMHEPGTALSANGLDSGRDEQVMRNELALNSVATLRRPLQVHGLRLMELTERESSVMRVTEIEEFASRDPVIKAFGTFGQSRDVAVGGQIAVVPDHSFSSTLLSRAKDLRSDFLLVPWSETGTMSEYPSLFDSNPTDPLSNRPFTNLAVEIFEKARATCHVGVIFDKTVLCPSINHHSSNPESPLAERAPRQLSRTITGMSLGDHMNSTIHFKLSDSGRYRLFALYQSGSEDDLLAVRLALQLAKNDLVDLKILNLQPNDSGEPDNIIRDKDPKNIDSRQVESFKSPADSEFETLRSTIATSHASERVSILDLELSAVEAVMAALSEASGAETLLLLGRGTAYLHHAGAHSSGNTTGDQSLSSSAILPASAGSSSAKEDSRAIGLFSTQVVRQIREKQIETNLLVVQARRDTASEGHEEYGAFGVPHSPKDVRHHALTKKLSHMSED
jgi:Kef-type K+ transport system membrane component KefB